MLELLRRHRRISITSDGFLVAPGYVDISNMTFPTLDYVPDRELTDDEIEGEGTMILMVIM